MSDSKSDILKKLFPMPEPALNVKSLPVDFDMAARVRAYEVAVDRDVPGTKSHALYAAAKKANLVDGSVDVGLRLAGYDCDQAARLLGLTLEQS
ncbi:MAG TPA: hypothetical protein PLO23_09035 [Alphaproteobacteria bacterium]|nr:hypothetical protein [Alphaproteobacteria bacterium]